MKKSPSKYETLLASSKYNPAFARRSVLLREREVCSSDNG